MLDEVETKNLPDILWDKNDLIMDACNEILPLALILIIIAAIKKQLKMNSIINDKY